MTQNVVDQGVTGRARQSLLAEDDDLRPRDVVCELELLSGDVRIASIGVPEPGTLTLLALGFFLVSGSRDASKRSSLRPRFAGGVSRRVRRD